MGKKRGKDKSQKEYDEEDIDLTGPSMTCSHVKKGIDHSFVKKSGLNSDCNACQDCKDDEQPSDTQPLECDEERDTTAAATTWMCLKCGHRGCGRTSENQHAIKHYETPRTDPHCLVLSMDNWSVWCYQCDEEVVYSQTGHLAQLVTNIKKQALSKNRNKTSQRGSKVEASVLEELPVTTVDDNAEENEDNLKKNGKKKGSVRMQKPVTAEDKSVVSVKGLSNLGNTCFFNAVIQNISQTQMLRQILCNVTMEKINLNITPGASSDLEPIMVELDQPGSMTLSMCQLLNEIQETKQSVVSPRGLFAQVCKKAARFKGFQQQDSQELLRYLLDGMRAEETRRLHSGLLETLKKNGKTEYVKEYEKNGTHRNFVDDVFGGEMTSTVMCRECNTVSLVTESFLDLSLPVSDEAYRKKQQKKGPQKTSESDQDDTNGPALTNGNDDIPTGAGSKYQQKKAKKQAKKQAKNQRRQQKHEGKMTLDTLSPAEPPDPESTRADPPDPESTRADPPDPESTRADPPDPESTRADPPDPESTRADPPDPEPVEHVVNGTQEDETGEHAENGTQEEAPVSPIISEQDIEEPSVAQANGESEENVEEVSMMNHESLDASPLGNRFTVLAEDQHPKNTDLEDGNTSETDQELVNEVQLADEMDKMSLNEGREDSEAVEDDEERDSGAEPKEYTVVNQNPEVAFSTLATRTNPDKQECSVQSCLFQFTEVENLTQTNRLLCVTCTKRHADKNNSDGSKKNTYTDAFKQMLISSPPPVLTLHLKRFQQIGHSVCKVNRHVQFPQILDLAPFCSKKCKNVPEGDHKVLYSLYGIVEHSGTMRSGHYTANVKARPQCPTSSSNGAITQGDAAEPPKGSWFHISDSNVQPVAESKVQGSQAYLLFYERIH